MKHYQGGGGLIEALISLVTISIGVLGMIGMQAALLAENGESRVRMQAGFLATSILGMAAANPENVGCFIVNTTQTAPCASPDAQAQAVGWTDQCVGHPSRLRQRAAYGGLRHRQRAAHGHAALEDAGRERRCTTTSPRRR